MISEVLLVNVAPSIPHPPGLCPFQPTFPFLYLRILLSWLHLADGGGWSPGGQLWLPTVPPALGLGGWAWYREVVAPGALATRECGWPPQGATRYVKGSSVLGDLRSSCSTSDFHFPSATEMCSEGRMSDIYVFFF